jgi:DNA-binding transcriptional ArsR family regulator
MTTHEQIRTLSNPVKLEILRTLKYRGKCPAGVIKRCMKDDISTSQLSQHLSNLRLNQLVVSEKHKGRPQYSLNQEAVNSVISLLAPLGQ